MDQNLQLKDRNKTNFVSVENVGKPVLLSGFVSNTRIVGKNLVFIILQDWYGYAQVVFSSKVVSEELLAEIGKLPLQSVIAVSGTIQKGNSTKYSAELLASSMEILAKSEPELPIDMVGNTATVINKRLDWRSLDLRKPENQAIFKIESKLIEGAYEYGVKNGFVNIYTPSIMGVVAESGSEMFSVDYFGKKAYLRQDPQLHRQLTIAGGFEKIFEVGPSWRAELSHTIRHLCEHRTIAFEMAYISDEKDTMRLEEEVIISAFKKVKKDCKKELELLQKKIKVPKAPFPELKYPEIYGILEGLGRKIEYGKDHDWESEVLLAKYVKKKYKSEFFFINRFPFAVKPFYVMRVDDEPMWARSVDMIYKGIEMSSGGQRENRHDKLMAQMKEKGMKNVEWFTDVFKYGVPPHGGFSIGIERLTMQLLGIGNVRETTLYPRDPERLVP